MHMLFNEAMWVCDFDKACHRELIATCISFAHLAASKPVYQISMLLPGLTFFTSTAV